MKSIQRVVAGAVTIAAVAGALVAGTGQALAEAPCDAPNGQRCVELRPPSPEDNVFFSANVNGKCIQGPFKAEGNLFQGNFVDVTKPVTVNTYPSRDCTGAPLLQRTIPPADWTGKASQSLSGQRWVIITLG